MEKLLKCSMARMFVKRGCCSAIVCVVSAKEKVPFPQTFRGNGASLISARTVRPADGGQSDTCRSRHLACLARKTSQRERTSTKNEDGEQPIESI